VSVREGRNLRRKPRKIGCGGSTNGRGTEDMTDIAGLRRTARRVASDCDKEWNGVDEQKSRITYVE
jgi:hypothetical protein